MELLPDLLDKINRSFELGTLDYKWHVRNYLSKEAGTDSDDGDSSELINYLIGLAISSFKYYQTHKKTLESDLSLKTVTSLCNCPELAHDVSVNDTDVFFLSRLFNEMINSDRGLHRCYDCGTNARAIFLKLLEVHRKKLHITPTEQTFLKEKYQLDTTTPLKTMEECRNCLLSTSGDSVFICSVGFGHFGHVWVIEKLCRQRNSPRYHLYQSSFRAYLVLDYIELADYGNNPEQSLDINNFFDKLKPLLEHRPWETTDYAQFAEMFAFTTNGKIDDTSRGFCYGYISY